MNTQENNKLIADFMGVRNIDDTKYIETLKEMRADGLYFEQGYMTSELKYDTDWRWLMEVVEKIERLGFTVEKNFQPIDNDWQCLVVKGNDILFQEFNEQSIQAMHYVVSEFIEWYNLNNLKNS